MGITFAPSIDKDEALFIGGLLKDVPDDTLQTVIRSRKNANVIVRHGLHANHADPWLHFNIMIVDYKNPTNNSSGDHHAHVIQNPETLNIWVADISPPLALVQRRSSSK